jgi:hypothetical protein
MCGSCIARRMSETAAHLVDSVLPEVPIRQWVASFSWRLRYLMGYDRKLASEVLSAFMQSVRDRVAWRVKRERYGLKSVTDVETGAVLFVQRFDSALRLNVHAHSMALDGGYVQTPQGLEFHRLDDVTQADVQWVAERTNKRIETILIKHGRTLDDVVDVDPVGEQDPFLAECYSGAIAGRGTLRLIQGDEHDAGSSKKLVAQATHLNVHADRVVDGRDRPQLERLCRYMLRPPFAQSRLRLLPDGRVHYQMKSAWRDGTSSLVFEPMEFIRRLCALVPPPFFNMIRYYGILAPHALLRKLVVPRRDDQAAKQLPLFSAQDVPLSTPGSGAPRIAWAQLLKRVFKFDVTVCVKCDGPVRVLEAVTKKEDIRRALLERGLPADPPELHPPRAPPQGELDFNDAC